MSWDACGAGAGTAWEAPPEPAGVGTHGVGLYADGIAFTDDPAEAVGALVPYMGGIAWDPDAVGMGLSEYLGGIVYGAAAAAWGMAGASPLTTWAACTVGSTTIVSCGPAPGTSWRDCALVLVIFSSAHGSGGGAGRAEGAPAIPVGATAHGTGGGRGLIGFVDTEGALRWMAWVE